MNVVGSTTKAHYSVCGYCLQASSLLATRLPSCRALSTGILVIPVPTMRTLLQSCDSYRVLISGVVVIKVHMFLCLGSGYVQLPH